MRVGGLALSSLWQGFGQSARAPRCFQWVRAFGKREVTNREPAGALNGSRLGGRSVRRLRASSTGPVGLLFRRLAPQSSPMFGSLPMKNWPCLPGPAGPPIASRSASEPRERRHRSRQKRPPAPARGARPPRCARGLVLRPRRGRRSRWKGPGALAKPRCRPANSLRSLRERERPSRYVKLRRLWRLWITSRSFLSTSSGVETLKTSANI
jgi:hypothetical protein